MRLPHSLGYISSLALFLSTLISPNLILAQSNGISSCEQALDEAKNLYREGKLNLVREQFTPECIYTNRLSKENKVQAFRLFTETSLFTNEIDNATQYFEILLRHNPLFEVDSTDAIASYDLIYLSRTYKKTPIISWYATLGLNYTNIATLQNYSAMSNITTTRDLSKITVGFNLATGIELPLYKNFDLTLEGFFSNRTYHKFTHLHVVSNTNHVWKDQAPELYQFGSVEFTERQLAIDIPLTIRYNYHWKKKIIPYAYVGIAPSFLLNAKLKGLVRRNVADGLHGGQVAGSSENDLVISRSIINDVNGNEDRYKSTYHSLRNTFNFSVLAGIGCKFRVDENFLFFDIRYSHFLTNAVNVDNRYTQKELLNRFAYVDDDFSIRNVSISFGYIKSFYTPRKKKEYNARTAAKNFDREIEAYKASGISNPNVIDPETKKNMEDEMEKNKENFLNDIKAGRATAKDADKYIDRTK